MKTILLPTASQKSIFSIDTCQRVRNFALNLAINQHPVIISRNKAKRLSGNLLTPLILMLMLLFSGSAFSQTRVQNATGNTGSGAAASIIVTLTSAPTNGNTLIAVISTRGNSANRVSSISETGAAWSFVSQATNTNGTTTEIWYAPNVSGASTTITIVQASLRSAAVVIEYSGLLTSGSVDLIASTTGSSNSASTGTTATTNQMNELWIGGIGLVNSGYTLGTPTNSFNSVANAASTSSTSGNNAKVYALERIATATGTANSGGTVSNSNQWSGAIATFKAVPPPAPAITSLGSTAGCQGTPITINGTNLTGAIAANVTIGGTPVTSITSNTGTVLVAIPAAGSNGIVSVTTGGGTGTSGSTTFMVNALPVAGAITGGNSVCMGSTLALSSNASGTPTLTYIWASSDPTKATVNNTTGVVTPVAAGNTNFTYTVTDGSTTACTATSIACPRR